MLTSRYEFECDVERCHTKYAGRQDRIPVYMQPASPIMPPGWHMVDSLHVCPHHDVRIVPVGCTKWEPEKAPPAHGDPL